MKHTIQISRTAHYYSQIPKQSPSSILVVIHGYAQTAEEFLKEFSDLLQSSTIVIAPEAISKFYNREKQPVASWMTSMHREDEIKDYLLYLDTFLNEVKTQYGNLPVSILGFSQGVSTAMRWVFNTSYSIEKVYLCSGTIPPELVTNDSIAKPNTPFVYSYGLNDRLLKHEKALVQIQLLQQLDLDVKTIAFNEGHIVPKELIQYLLS